MIKSLSYVDEYVLFEEIDSDSLGINYRAGLLDNSKVISHKIITEVHDFIFHDTATENMIISILEEVGRSKVKYLYSPEKILKKGNKIYLVYPYIYGKTLKQILDKCESREDQIIAKLALPLALRIINILDIGRSLNIDNEQLYHGLLLPDNIIISYSGEIYIKYLGVWSNLMKTLTDESVFLKTIYRYGSILSPEFINREKIYRYTDIYNLGNLIHRMITGEYFPYTQGMNFNNYASSFVLKNDVSGLDKNYIINLFDLFRKCLNPEINNRFKSLVELSDYLENIFNIHDSSIIASDLASLMYSLFYREKTDEKEIIKTELTIIPPIDKPTDKIFDENLVTLTESTNIGKKKIMLSFITVISIIIIVAFFIKYSDFQNQNKISKKKSNDELGKKITQLEEKYQNRVDQLKKYYEDRINNNEGDDEILIREKQKLIEETNLEKNKKIRLVRKDSTKYIKPSKKISVESSEYKIINESKPAVETQYKQVQSNIKNPNSKVDDEVSSNFDTVKKDFEPKLISSRPIAIGNQTLNFPKAMYKTYAGKQGKLDVELLIDENGKVSKLELIGDVPVNVKRVITDCIKNWKYKPAMKKGIKVKSTITKRIKFSFKQNNFDPGNTIPVNNSCEVLKKDIKLIDLNKVDKRPQKISGEIPEFSDSVKLTYAGRSHKVKTSLLINNAGNVELVTIESSIPPEIQSIIINTLKKWRFTPAFKDKKEVNVLYPVSFKLSFK